MLATISKDLGDVQGPTSRSLGCAYLDLKPVKARLWAVWSERGLQNLCWGAAGATAAEVIGDAPAQGELPDPYRSVLEAYLAGQDVEPSSLPVDLAGTAFQIRVWNALRRIPRGAVKSYAAIANEIGSPRGMRAVGGANGRNPVAIVVPCHRVVQTGKSLGGYTGGLHLKRFLLELEGCKIDSDQVRPGQLELI